MARHRDFGAGKKLSDFEELSFTLAGEDFKCKPAVQGKKLLRFVADADSNSGGRAAEALYSIFKEVMPADEYERFMKLLDSEEAIFDLSEIGDIAAWLVEQYTERPTEPQLASVNGRTTSGRASTGAAS